MYTYCLVTEFHFFHVDTLSIVYYNDTSTCNASSKSIVEYPFAFYCKENLDLPIHVRELLALETDASPISYTEQVSSQCISTSDMEVGRPTHRPTRAPVIVDKTPAPTIRSTALLEFQYTFEMYGVLNTSIPKDMIVRQHFADMVCSILSSEEVNHLEVPMITSNLCSCDEKCLDVVPYNESSRWIPFLLPILKVKVNITVNTIDFPYMPYSPSRHRSLAATTNISTMDGVLQKTINETVAIMTTRLITYLYDDSVYYDLLAFLGVEHSVKYFHSSIWSFVPEIKFLRVIYPIPDERGAILEFPTDSPSCKPSSITTTRNHSFSKSKRDVLGFCIAVGGIFIVAMMIFLIYRGDIAYSQFQKLYDRSLWIRRHNSVQPHPATEFPRGFIPQVHLPSVSPSNQILSANSNAMSVV